MKSQRMHKKSHKVSRLFAFPQDVGRNIYLIFVPAWMQYCTLNYMEIYPVSNRERDRLCTASSRCCFAAHRAELSMVSPAALGES